MKTASKIAIASILSLGIIGGAYAYGKHRFGDPAKRATHAVNYVADELEQITIAYATSVHKSQGSEYPAVIVPLLTQHYVLLQRNLLYTAITRGKKLVILIGTEKALQIALKNDKPLRRLSSLAVRLSSNI